MTEVMDMKMTELTESEMQNLEGAGGFADICAGLAGLGTCITIIATAEITVPLLIGVAIIDIASGALAGYGAAELANDGMKDVTPIGSAYGYTVYCGYYNGGGYGGWACGGGSYFC